MTIAFTMTTYSPAPAASLHLKRCLSKNLPILACASGALQSNLLLRRQSLVIDNVGVFKNYALRVSRVSVNKTSISDYSYDQSRILNFDGDGEDYELGPILNFEEVMTETKAKGVSLPLDMLEAAKGTGIPKLFLLRFLSMQGIGWGLGFAMRSCSMFRNQMMIDPWYPIGVVMKVGRGIIVAFNYGDDIIDQQRKSISQGFMDNSSMFVAKRSSSVISAAYWCSYIYCCVGLVSTSLIIQFYGSL